MNILKSIFGGGDVIKAGMQLIDDMHTSTEEEIQATTKAKTDLLKAYAPFKLSQRYLAMLFAGTFLSSFLLVLGLTLESGGGIDDVKVVLDEFYIGEIMLTIIIFYFGGGVFEGVIAKRKEK